MSPAEAGQLKQGMWTMTNVKHEMPDTPPRTPPMYVKQNGVTTAAASTKNIHGLKIVFPVAMDDLMTVVATPTDTPHIKSEVNAGKVKIQPKPCPPPQKVTIVTKSGSNGE